LYLDTRQRKNKEKRTKSEEEKLNEEDEESKEKMAQLLHNSVRVWVECEAVVQKIRET